MSFSHSISNLQSKPSYRYDHILAYLRSPPTTVDHVTSPPHAVQLHAATRARLEALLILRDEAAYLGLSELVELCSAELRRNPNVYLTQLMRTPSHVHAHSRGASHGSMRSMGTVRERDEDDGSADADIGSNSTGRDSIGSAKAWVAHMAVGVVVVMLLPSQPEPESLSLPPPHQQKELRSFLRIQRRLRSSVVGSIARAGSAPS